MYFVCYVVLARQNVILPVHWLNDHNLLMVKYINQRLNSNQKVLAYYSQNEFNEIECGRSPKDFQPKFGLSMNVTFPDDGCYYVLPKKCFETMDDAKHFVETRRRIPPAVYNEDREQEQPIPNTAKNSLDTISTSETAESDHSQDQLLSESSSREINVEVHGTINVQANVTASDSIQGTTISF